MKDCTGTYSIKSFSLMFSNYLQKWIIEPNFLLKEYGDDELVLNFICNNQIIGKKTIKATKEYIKELIEAGTCEKLKTELESELSIL